MKITLKWLRKYEACLTAEEWFKKQNTTDAIELINLLDPINDSNHFNWIIWTVTKKFNKTENVKFAVFCAKLVLPIFEEKYPKTNRPRKAVEAAENWLKNKTKENKLECKRAAIDTYATAAACARGRAATYAARAAASTANAAANAANAANAATTNATYAATYAATDVAATNATYAATYAATDVAATNSQNIIKMQIIDYIKNQIKKDKK